jgi:hypothetical protein
MGNNHCRNIPARYLLNQARKKQKANGAGVQKDKKLNHNCFCGNLVK